MLFNKLAVFVLSAITSTTFVTAMAIPSPQEGGEAGAGLLPGLQLAPALPVLSGSDSITNSQKRQLGGGEDDSSLISGLPLGGDEDPGLPVSAGGGEGATLPVDGLAVVGPGGEDGFTVAQKRQLGGLGSTDLGDNSQKRQLGSTLPVDALAIIGLGGEDGFTVAQKRQLGGLGSTDLGDSLGLNPRDDIISQLLDVLGFAKRDVGLIPRDNLIEELLDILDLTRRNGVDDILAAIADLIQP